MSSIRFELGQRTYEARLGHSYAGTRTHAGFRRFTGPDVTVTAPSQGARGDWTITWERAGVRVTATGRTLVAATAACETAMRDRIRALQAALGEASGFRR